MKTKPNIRILATGGTIAGVAPSSTETGYSSGKINVRTILDTIPGMADLANVKGEQFSNVGSQDISFEIMIGLANRINELLEQEDTDGIVVTHGTDTMEETAFFLNLVVKSPKPVVMTGAMRPSTAISADGPLNLYNSIAVAAEKKSWERGIMVVMNDRIHGAHSLTKSNTTSVETFLSPVNGLMGTVIFGTIKFFRGPFRKHTYLSEFSIDSTMKLPRVDIIYACADMPPDLVGSSVSNGARGIVFAGDGNGNMNKATVLAASQKAAQGIYIVRSSRVPTGTVGRNVEIDDDVNQFIASDELNPAKSRILLMLALLEKRSVSDIQSLFYTY